MRRTGRAAKDLAVEVGPDFPTTIEPVGTGLDGAAILKDERIGQIGKDVGLGLVVVGGLGSALVGYRRGAKIGFLQPEKTEEAKTVLFSGKVDGFKLRVRCDRGD